MRALLPKQHSLLGPLTLSLGLFLTACTTSHVPPVEAPEINTYNAYINNTDNTINYYTVDNDTLTQHKVADFEPAPEGFNNALLLDFDEDKQGFEYIVYVTEDNSQRSVINLYNLDKEKKGEHDILTTISSNLCGISAGIVPSTHAFDVKGDSNISTKNTQEITMHLSATEDCQADLYHEAINISEFLDETNREPRVEHIFIDANETDPILIIDYNISFGLSSNREETGYGYLNYNSAASELSFRYNELNELSRETEAKVWSTQLPFEEPMTINQVANNYVLFQQGRNLYVVSTQTLFNIDNVDNSSTIPVQARLDALFATPSMVIPDHQDPTIKLNKPLQRNEFLVQIENDIYIYQDDEFKLIHSSTFSQDIVLTYLLNSLSETLLLIEQTGAPDSLTLISANGTTSSIMEAEQIEIDLNDDTFYVNTINLSAESGAQAHELTKIGGNYDITTIDNSTLIHVFDMRNEYDLPLLISNEPERNVSGTRQLAGMYLYKYDENARSGNGRALAQSSRENERGRIEYRQVDFSYGIFQDLSNIEFIDGIIVNDFYGFLNFRATYSSDGIEQSADFSFVFNPNQETPDPDIEDQSLSLLLVNGS